VIEIRQGFQFDLCGLTAQAIELPGHMEGSVGFLDSQKRFFMGDAIGARKALVQLERALCEEMESVLENLIYQEKMNGKSTLCHRTRRM
jgi:glyoxylase-like metal-dependent hydrolase (beta-lactamase superfamily II)